MIWIVMVLGLIFAVIVCFLAAKMKIIFEYRDGNLKIVFKSLFLRFTLDESRLKKLSSRSGTLNEKKSKPGKSPETDGKSEEFTAESFFEKIKRLKEVFLTFKDVAVTVFGYLGPRTEIADISVKSRFGTGDAAETGMICGAIWSLSGSVYAFLCRFFSLEFPDIQLEPLFDKKFFEIEARGIIKIRPVHIITVALRGFKVYDKYKKEKGVD